MNKPTDRQLLADYAAQRSEAAFAELVRRHVDLVHSAALRLVRDAHAAQDVTQGVFVALAQNARQLTDRPALEGWLHCTTRNLAANAVRSEVRRRTREQEAALMNELLSADPDTRWEHIAPQLDDALGELDEPDRDALLLRYFKNHDLRTVGATLGISDDAAQKRVSRAVERLRECFAKRGLTVGAGGLVGAISANAIQAAPVGLAVTISTAAALAGTTLATTATATATKAIAMTTLQKTLVSATVAVLAGAGIYEARQASQLREQDQTLQERQAPLAEQIRQLQHERDVFSNDLAVFRDDNERLNRNTAELLKLRGEVGMLRSDARDSKGTENDPLVQKAREWKAKEAKLRQLFEEKPEQRIPEMRWLVDDQWQSIARDADLDTTRGIRVALGRVREVAMIQFSLKIKQALFTYMNANDKRLPDDPSQLAPYFRPPVDDAEAILSRYEMLSKERQSEAPFKGASIIQKVLIDKAVDNALIVGLSTMGFVPKQGHAPVNLPRELGPVLKAYMDANNHTSPLDNDDLKPYATTPEQKAALEKFIRDLSQ